MTTRLVLADDHPVVLDGLARLIGREPDFELVACCGDGETALRATRRHRPDILVLDLRMPKLDGLEVVRRLAADGPGTRVVVLSGTLDEDELIEAVRLGVAGVVTKDAAFARLAGCLRAVRAGERCLEGRLLGRTLERLVAEEAARRGGPGGLGVREVELVGLVARGLRNKEVGARLGLTEGGVKVQLHRIFGRLGVGSRTELANYARAHGMLR